MASLLEGTEQLERELASTQDSIAAPAAGSLALHGVLFGGLLLYGVLNGFFHHNLWGNPGAGGAIQVSLVSNALPLPADQPPNQNVLATETPSHAPAPPTPKATQAVDETAIPISGKQEKPQKQTAPKTQQHQPQPKQNNLAQFGEQAGSSMPRATMAQNTASNGPVSVANGDFGSRFGWYVEVIKRKVSQNWNRVEVDASTPKGVSSEIYFRVDRQGAPSNFRINKSSGSSTLDQSCLRATQRVDTFGDLPRDSNDQWLDVTYDCTY
jgi:periplasmic protein TonB